jgi:hypothetical protein
MATITGIAQIVTRYIALPVTAWVVVSSTELSRFSLRTANGTQVRCLLCPRKRTSVRQSGMSALCQKRTSIGQQKASSDVYRFLVGTATISSCAWDDAPSTPHPPSIWPSRRIGKPPRTRYSGNPSPSTSSTREWKKPTTSPLGSPVPAEAMAFPTANRSTSKNAPSMRLSAITRPFATLT